MVKEKRIKIKNRKSDIFEAFKKLKFSFKHRGIGFYSLVKPDGVDTGIEFWFPRDEDILYRVEKKIGDYNGTICFMVGGCFLEWLGDDCISLVPKEPKKNAQAFINFSNYEVK